MTTFDDREKAFEAKFKLDQEMQFKANVRRDKLLGLWAAEQMGMSGDAAKAYALTVVDAEFTEPDHDASHKVARDLAAKGVQIDERQLKQEADRFLALALEQLGMTEAKANPAQQTRPEEDPNSTVSGVIGQFLGKTDN